jgi:hypothetical protein
MKRACPRCPKCLASSSDFSWAARVPREVALQDVQRGHVVVAPQHVGNGIESGREGDALLQLGEPLEIAEVRSRRADGVQGMCAEIVEPELLGQPQRLATELARGLKAIGQHLIASHLAEHGNPCT